LTHAHDVAELSQALALHPDVDVVLLDVAFDLPPERLAPPREPHLDLEKRRRLQGLDILAHLRRTRADLPVVLMTSEDELAFEDAAAALAVDEFVTLAGADAFDARALGLLVERVLARRPVAAEVGRYYWGASAAMARLKRDASVLARTSLPLLLLGESGTGKSASGRRVPPGRPLRGWSTRRPSCPRRLQG
jgi:CheY-like chemotaxis protein